MSDHDSQPPRSFPIVTVALALLRADTVTVISKLLTPFALRFFRRHEGMYEVLDYEARLELCDSKGKEARFSKRWRVRFLQDNIIAYQDQAWGDGDFLVDYQCSPGVMTDNYREGHKYRILISLRETKNRGDIEDFHIQRTIKNSFTKDVEDFQIEIDHPTRKLLMVIVFPRSRSPKHMKLIEQKTQHTAVLNEQYVQELPDGRWQVRWETDRLRLHEAYIVRWEW